MAGNVSREGVAVNRPADCLPPHVSEPDRCLAGCASRRLAWPPA